MMKNNNKCVYKSINTPICDFVKAYGDAKNIRLHMPGHKGKQSEYALDITEINGADSLYEANGIIAESEENASRIFGSHTFYSCEGSSLPIRAMIRLVCLYAYEKGETPNVSAARNVHGSFISAAALLGVNVNWITSKKQKNYLSCPLDGQDVDRHFKSLKKLPTALYLTSPDYIGNVADIREIAEVCHKCGVLLLVDNAHGAYTKFLSPSLHPIGLGADMCADSAHKTLNTLTGAGYLHISLNAPKILSENAKRALSLFGSTSPSYLILQSLDKLNPYLATEYPTTLEKFCSELDALKATLKSADYRFVGEEPLKLTIDAKKHGYTGTEIADLLRADKIEVEFSDNDFTVMMFTPENSSDELERVKTALLKIPKKPPIIDLSPDFHLPKSVMPIYEAYKMPTKTVPLEEAVGQISGAMHFTCPPAVPIVIAGEEIDEETARILSYYGKTSIEIIKT